MSPLFASLFEEVFFWGILTVYFGTAVIWILRNRVRRGKRRRDFVPLILPTILVDIAIGYARIGALPHWLFYPGELLFVVGGAFTAWSYSLLGRYLTPYAEVLPEHRLVERGPYRHIRHPGYLGAIVALAGLGLAMQSWLALVVMLVVAGGALAHRVRIEEELMAAELGDSYVDYMTRTKRFVPFIW